MFLDEGIKTLIPKYVEELVPILKDFFVEK